MGDKSESVFKNFRCETRGNDNMRRIEHTANVVVGTRNEAGEIFEHTLQTVKVCTRPRPYISHRL